MESAAESFSGLFLRECEHTTETADGEKVTKFFKPFPSIGRTDVGPEAHRGYVCKGVSARAKDAFAAKRQAAADGACGLGEMFYANAVMRLFEHIAKQLNNIGSLLRGITVKEG